MNASVPDLTDKPTLAEVLELSTYAQRALTVEAGSGDRLHQLAIWGRLADAAWTGPRQRNELAALLAEREDSAAALAAALRRLRRKVLLALIARDATGSAHLQEVVSTMSVLAEIALNAAVALHAHELAAVHGVPIGEDGVAQDLLVVGMGKLGGGELNVSSDIDLIFVYDQDGSTRAAENCDAVRTLSNHEFFLRLGRRVIGALEELTADGFVFRVDMRLRPNGDAGPLALSLSMLEQYLMVQGREWERFAWLKGRVVSQPVFGDEKSFAAQCAALDDVVRPFVYRKYLDFGAIAALRELHSMVRAETEKRARGREERSDNVKLGRGGIREIEFIAQTFQIIRGGRSQRLRSRSTLQTLESLGASDVLPIDVTRELVASYIFLRNLEHALQYVDDAQTHAVPPDTASRVRIARLLGMPADQMLQRYRAVQEFVAATFDSIFVEPSEDDAPPSFGPITVEGRPAAGTALLDHLRSLSYREPEASAARVLDVLIGRRVATTSETTRSRIERLIRTGIQLAADAKDVTPDELLARFLRLLEIIAGRSTYVALLNQYPKTLARVLRLLATSTWATDYLLRHPILLDELLDERLAKRALDWTAWCAELEAQLVHSPEDTEHQLNVLRDAHHAQVFRLLLADLDDRLTVETLADHLSELAVCTVAIALSMAWTSLAKKHRESPAFAVIGYGKLGGKELGYASDLDLVFVYDDPHPDAAEIYGALLRRLLNWLSAQTSSGNLFEIDLRLRPNGDAGLMVSSSQAFERYQRNEDGHGAWTWEHQALSRARFVAGADAVGARFEALRTEILQRSRVIETLRADVLAMRQKMLEGHPNRSPLFDLKHDRGGMVDIEFVVQFWVLGYAHQYPLLVMNVGNIALLHRAGELGLVDALLAAEVAASYRRFRRLQHRLRLNSAPYARVPAADVAAEVASVLSLWQRVFEPTR